MVSPFERLPVEVFDIIALHFDLSSYCAIRLASQRLHLLSFSTFTKRHFSELSTTLGSASLDRLVSVSSQPYLCTVVTVLDVRLLNHRDYKLLTTIRRVGKYPPPKRFPQVTSVKPQHISQEATLYDDLCRAESSTCVVDRLARALAAFSNLRTMRFHARHPEPLGWHSSNMPEGDVLFRSECFRAVIDAVIKSEVQLTEFSMVKGKKKLRSSKNANLPHPAFQLPLPSLLALQHTFLNLETLVVSMTASHNEDARLPGWENGLSQLISTAPLIKHLALCLDRSHNISHYGAAVIRSITQSCHLSKLQTFRLANTSVHEEHLAAFFTTHAASLSKIILSDTKLLTGNWSSLWTSFDVLKELRYLKLLSLQGTNAPVQFRHRSKLRHSITLEANEERPMVAMLDDLITACNSESDLSMAYVHVV
ncbi:hypothetical protein IQ07DRAFT_341418 [Pyrenochaeta sp. DS3sAY3a]|nr:hypothetical protein IQ07DRAFT_341418 [Pyrenochaeta sp. DS3sAY3a]